MNNKRNMHNYDGEERTISESAYEVSQQALTKLIEALRCEASQIEGLGESFKEVDEELTLLAELVANN